MMWKKFTVSIFCLAACCSAFACIYFSPEIDELYMFKTFDIGEAKYGCYYDFDYQYDSNVDFWYEYVNAKVGKADIKDALYHSSKDDIDNNKYLFFRYLHQNNDKSAIRYWTLTKRFSSYSDDPWYYPTKAEHLELKELAGKLQSEVTVCENPKLKERFMMQFMRICFYLKEYALCIDTWKNYNSKWQSKLMEEKCRSYYAGALYHTGQRVDAANIYAELGDWESLNCYRNSVAFMRELYNKYPSSKAFNYFVQKFENNYQMQGRLVDSEDFLKLCGQVLEEQKTDNPALWQSAVAHIAFLDGDLKKARQLIGKASEMKGDLLTAENVRMLRLLYNAASVDDADYDKNISVDLPWLLKKAYDSKLHYYEEYRYSEHYYNMVKRLVFQYLVPHYSAQNNPNMAVAILNAFDEIDCYDKEEREAIRKDKTIECSWDYSRYFFSYLDTTSIENVKNFLAFVKSGGKTELEKSLIKAGYVRESMINELIGTKYMRLDDYETALQYLQKVSPSFWIKQNITEYLDRNPFHEKWIKEKSERGVSTQQYNPAKIYAEKPTKIQFCLIMNELKRLSQIATDDAECAVYNYEYAVGLVQSHDWCWALTQYEQGYTYFDGVLYQADEESVDNGWNYLTSNAFVMQERYKKINSYIDNVEKLTDDAELKARSLYLRSSIELDEMRSDQYAQHLLNDFKDTKFHQKEISHCDLLY